MEVHAGAFWPQTKYFFKSLRWGPPSTLNTVWLFRNFDKKSLATYKPQLLRFGKTTKLSEKCSPELEKIDDAV